MTGKQRVDDLLAGKKVDKLPNFTIVGAVPARMAGVKIGDWCQNADLLADAAVMAAEELKLDYYQLQSDTYREAVDYGCEIEYLADKLPAVHTPVILTTEDALKLRPLQVENAPRMLQTVQTVEKVAAHKDRYMMPLVMGPMSILGSMRGVSNLMMDFYDDLLMVEGMLAVMVETQKNFIKAIVEAGSGFIYIADPVASLVSPQFFQEVVLPTLADLIAYSHSLGAKARLHICGNTTAILPFTTACGAEVLDIDHPVEYGAAVKLAQGKTIINGNLNPVGEVFSSTPDKIVEAVLLRHRQAEGNRSMIMPGCELPADTPVENVLALHEGLLACAALERE